jgi:hypothetical protein
MKRPKTGLPHGFIVTGRKKNTPNGIFAARAVESNRPGTHPIASLVEPGE